MSTIAILGVVWMIAMVLGIWSIAGLLFIAEMRQRRGSRAPELLKHFKTLSEEQIKDNIKTIYSQSSHLGSKESV